MLPSAQALDGTVALAPLPSNLPSSVLLQRPDVLSAEHALQAGQRRYRRRARRVLPTLTLTANYGHSSTALSTLFSAGTAAGRFAPSITAPIFHAVR